MTEVPHMDLTSEERLMSGTILTNLDAFLFEQRWLKGNWHDVRIGDNPFHGNNECLANFVRRIEYGEAKGPGKDQTDVTETLTERVLLCAANSLFDGFREVEPEDRPDSGVCDNPGCENCERYRQGLSTRVPYGPFSCIPEFNDHELTTFQDVEAVVKMARKIVMPPTTIATEVMDLDEAYEIERASIEASAQVRLERWEQDLQDRGWLSRLSAGKSVKARKRIEKERAIDLKWLEYDYEIRRKEDLRADDCVGAGC